jgi:hypothetical protein
MINFEDVKKYLPQYLSDFANENLFSELKNFPENLDTKLYTNYLTETESLYQGDGICGLPHAELPSPYIKEVNGMILSNTCDVDQSNPRLSPTKLVHAPIINLNKYQSMLVELFVDTKQKPQEYIDQHISSIKNQYISHIFYLPKGSGLHEDSLIFFDRVSSLPSNYIAKNKIVEKRLFTLSDFGFYLFLFKLSVHFTRVRENVSRNGSE